MAFYWRTGLCLLLLIAVVNGNRPREDQCLSDPCMNGGTCVEGVLSYICLCSTFYDGQNCQLNATGTPCSMNFYSEVGNLTSPNYPEQANNLEECDYHLKIPPAYSISLVVRFFETEEHKDTLTFGPGPAMNISSTDQTVIELDGNLTNAPLQNLTYVFDTNQVWFNWYADKNTPSNGFFISWDSVPNSCEDWSYGPSCTSCFCLNDAACDRNTGQCPGRACAAGYEVYDGQYNCSECRGGFFGLNCSESCHCGESSCDKVTGICNGSCFFNWHGEDCQTGVSSFTFLKVNPNQASNFTCTVQGDPLPEEDSVDLLHMSRDKLVDDGVIRESSSRAGSERHVQFTVDRVIPEGLYYCYLDSSFLRVVADTYVLPVLEEAPSVTNTTTTSVTLEWTPWRVGVDAGDPPLIQYAVYAGQSSGNVTEKERVDQPVTSVTVTGLDPDTVYELSVAAVREGTGGTGPRSPAVSVTTDPAREPDIIIDVWIIFGGIAGATLVIILIAVAIYYCKRKPDDAEASWAVAYPSKEAKTPPTSA